MRTVRPVDMLDDKDFALSPVWTFDVVGHSESDTLVTPVATPVSHLFNRVVGTRVRFSNGDSSWAVLGEIDPDDTVWNSNFLGLTIIHGKSRFPLARYHDFFQDARPKQSSFFFGVKRKSDISYFLRHRLRL